MKDANEWAKSNNHNPISFDGVKEIVAKGYDKKYDSDLVDSILRKHKAGKSPREIHNEVEEEYHGKEGKPKNPIDPKFPKADPKGTVGEYRSKSK